MFPDLDFDFVVTDNETDTSNLYTYPGRTFLYDFKIGDFIYRNGAPIEVSGLEALKVWIEKIIRSEKQKYEIYDNVLYGVQIEDLIGSNMPKGFVESEINREISEALDVNPYILELTNWRFERIDSIFNVYFTVVTVDGAFDMEVIG